MKNNAGYSLLEVVVSLAVSAIVLGGLYLIFQTGARLNARADQNLREQQLVQNAAEYLLANGYDTVPSSPIPEVLEDVDVTAHDVDAEKGYCNVTVSSLENPDIKLSFDVCIAPTPAPSPSEDEGTGG